MTTQLPPLDADQVLADARRLMTPTPGQAFVLELMTLLDDDQPPEEDGWSEVAAPPGVLDSWLTARFFVRMPDDR